jgi:hypothetical protein
MRFNLEELETGKVKTVRIKSVNSDDALLERDTERKTFDAEINTQRKEANQEKIREKGWKQPKSKGETRHALSKLFSNAPQALRY